MKKIITATLFKKNLKTYWGFNFNTSIRCFVEQAMQSMNYGSGDYFLNYSDEAPEGIYTDVEILVKNEKMTGFKIKTGN